MQRPSVTGEAAEDNSAKAQTEAETHVLPPVLFLTMSVLALRRLGDHILAKWPVYGTQLDTVDSFRSFLCPLLTVTVPARYFYYFLHAVQAYLFSIPSYRRYRLLNTSQLSGANLSGIIGQYQRLTRHAMENHVFSGERPIEVL